MPIIPISASPNPYGSAELPLPVVSMDVAASFAFLTGPVGALIGSLTPISAQTARYTPPNQTGSFVIRGTSTADPANYGDVAISVFGRLPHQPNWGGEIDLDDKTLVSLAEDDNPIFSLKRGELQTWRLSWIDRPFTEKQDLRDFWKWHRKFRFWYYEDLSEGDAVGFIPQTYLVRFDSGLKITPGFQDGFNITAVVTQHPFTTP